MIVFMPLYIWIFHVKNFSFGDFSGENEKKPPDNAVRVSGGYCRSLYRHVCGGLWQL